MQQTLGVLLVSLGFSVLAGAQEARPKTIRSGLPAPVAFDAASGFERHWSYDWATGEITRIAAPPRGARLTRPVAAGGTGNLCFDNVDPVYLMTTHPVTHQELVDWGIKDCGFRCRVTSFTFKYRTGLPSVDLSIAFYAGTTGFGELGTQISRFSFQGLPAGEPDIQPGVLPDQFVNTVTVDISSSPMCLPDGPIGWSFTNDDLNSGSFLVSAPGPLGTLDALDVYDDPPATTGTYTGTFNFASTGFDVGSLQMQIEEEEDPSLAGVRLIQGTGFNPIALLPSDVPAAGRVWFGKVSFGEVPGATQSTFVLSANPLAPFPTVAGEILVDMFSAPLLIDTTTTAHRVDIPAIGLLGQTFYGQSILTGGGALQLTNALELIIGI